METNKEDTPKITDPVAKAVLQKEQTLEEVKKELSQIRKSYNEILGDYRILQSVNRELARLMGYYKEMYYFYRQLLNPSDKPTMPMWTDDSIMSEVDMKTQKEEHKKDWDLKPEKDKKEIQQEAQSKLNQ